MDDPGLNSVPADQGPGCVLMGLACNYLPHRGRLSKFFYSGGPRCNFDSHVSPPALAKVFTDFGCLETLQVTEGGPGRVLRGTACDDLPCGRRSLCIFRWRYLLEANLVHVMGRSLSRLRPWQIIRWLGCVVHMSKHLAFIHSFMSKFNLHMCLLHIHLTNAYTA